VKCNFRVYGEPVDCNPYFDGKKIWVLFPQQVSQRVFLIPALVEQKGKSVDEMRLEYTLENARKQLTMFLELESRTNLASSEYFQAVRIFLNLGFGNGFLKMLRL
jgi:hypothetical protein